VITRLILGGAQENTLYTVENLQDVYGDEVLLVAGPPEGPEGSLLERARKNNVPVQILPSLRRELSPTADAATYFALRRIFREFHPDVVHTHSSKAGVVGRAAAYAYGTPAIVHTIHGLPFHPLERWWRNRVYIAAERWAARRTHRLITVANAMTRQALAAGVGEAEQYTTIYSGMEVEPFLHPPRDPKDVRKELGYGPEHTVVAKVARLFELKGHDDVLAAAQLATREAPNLRFLFVGGGIWRDRLELKAREAGLADFVRFLGLVSPDRIPELLAASDLVVHASYREGLARVLPQALIAGRPVVSYDVDGACEVVRPGQTGALVPPGDVPGLAASLLDLVRDPEKRERFGLTGRALFTDQFRHDVMTRRIRDVYQEVLGR
jgi:glycosyltransferase involved in cell wall biosynthesis